MILWGWSVQSVSLSSVQVQACTNEAHSGVTAVHCRKGAIRIASTRYRPLANPQALANSNPELRAAWPGREIHNPCMCLRYGTERIG